MTKKEISNRQRVLKLMGLNSKIRLLIEQNQANREAMHQNYFYYKDWFGILTTGYFNHCFHSCVQDFNYNLKQQNRILKEIGRINKQRKQYRNYRFWQTQYKIFS